MSLHIYEWYSYSCNNSSDHRLVAEFSTPQAARAMAAELAEVFLDNARQAEAAEQGEADWGDPYDYDPSPALVAFAEKYGGEFTEGLIWGDDGAFTEDLPEIATLGNRVYVYHGYMSGGFDGDLPGILEKAGATSVDLHSGPAWLKFTGRAGNDDVDRLRAAVGEFMAQRHKHSNLCDWQMPWGEKGPIERSIENLVVLYPEEGAVFTVALGASAVAPMIEWLESKGASEVEVELATDAVLDALRAQADAGADRPRPTTEEPFDARDKTFLVTGKLAALSIEEVEARIEQLGGRTTRWADDADVVVVGDEDSVFLGQGPMTRGHRQAAMLNDGERNIAIITETLFLQLGG